jgi:hypothetical protein
MVFEPIPFIAIMINFILISIFCFRLRRNEIAPSVNNRSGLGHRWIYHTDLGFEGQKIARCDHPSGSC